MEFGYSAERGVFLQLQLWCLLEGVWGQVALRSVYSTCCGVSEVAGFSRETPVSDAFCGGHSQNIERFTLGSITRRNWPCFCLLGITCRVGCFSMSIAHLLVEHLLDQKLGLNQSVRWLRRFPSPTWLWLGKRLKRGEGPTFPNMESVMQEGKKERRPDGFEGAALTETAEARCGMGLEPQEQNSSGKIISMWFLQMNGYASLLYVFFFWFPVELRRGFQKVLDMFLPMLEVTFKVRCVPQSPPAWCCQQQC